MTTIYALMNEVTNEHLQPVTDLVHQLHVEGRLPCTCRECLLDVAAITLNTLRPRYTVSFLKELWVSDEQKQQYKSELERAVTEACERVQAHPHHDKPTSQVTTSQDGVTLMP